MQKGPVKRISHHVALSKPIAFGHFGQISANKSELAHDHRSIGSQRRDAAL